jgi:outer membrane protein
MKRILFLVLLFMLSSSLVSAQKYGFINSEFILSKMPEYKEAKDRLDKMADRWTKEIEERYKVLNQKKEQFNKEEVLLPAEEKEKRSEELTKMEYEVIELQKTRFGVSGEYFQKRQELIKPIQDKVYDAMQKVASKRSYTFIFDKSNQSNLIYADKKFDLSDEVIKEMGLKP